MSPVITTITIVSSTILFAFLLMSIVSFFVHGDSRKYYKKTYNAIKSGEYVLARANDAQRCYVPISFLDHYWLCRDSIVTFYDTQGKPDSIKLLSSGGHYIHKEGLPVLDFYAQYWFKKIIRVMNEQLMQIQPYEVKTKHLDINTFKFLRK